MLTVITWLYEAIKDSHRDYRPEHVDRMWHMFAKNYQKPFELVCFSEQPKELFTTPIDVRPLPAHNKGTLKRLWAFSQECADMFPGKRLFSVDLDVVFTRDLTVYLDRSEPLVMWTDPMLKKVTYRYAPVFLLDPGTYTDVWDSLAPAKMKQWYIDTKNKKVGNDMAWLSYYFHGKKMPTFVQHRARLIGDKLPKDAYIVHFSGTLKPWDAEAMARYPWLADHVY